MPKEPEYEVGSHQLAFANSIHMWEYKSGSGYKSAPAARVKRALYACHYAGRSHADNGLCRLWTLVQFLCLQTFACVVSMKMWRWNLTCPGSLGLSPSGLVTLRRIYYKRRKDDHADAMVFSHRSAATIDCPNWIHCSIDFIRGLYTKSRHSGGKCNWWSAG